MDFSFDVFVDSKLNDQCVSPGLHGFILFFVLLRGEEERGVILRLTKDTRDYAVTDDDGCFGVFRFIVAFFFCTGFTVRVPFDRTDIEAD